MLRQIFLLTVTKKSVALRIMNNEALKRAIEAAGGQTSLAKLIGTTQSHVWYWLEKSKRGVPSEHVLDIERATKISRHDLRPDIFGPAPVQEQVA